MKRYVITKIDYAGIKWYLMDNHYHWCLEINEYNALVFRSKNTAQKYLNRCCNYANRHIAVDTIKKLEEEYKEILEYNGFVFTIRKDIKIEQIIIDPYTTVSRDLLKFPNRIY